MNTDEATRLATEVVTRVDGYNDHQVDTLVADLERLPNFGIGAAAVRQVLDAMTEGFKPQFGKIREAYISISRRAQMDEPTRELSPGGHMPGGPDRNVMRLAVALMGDSSWVDTVAPPCQPDMHIIGHCDRHRNTNIIDRWNKARVEARERLDAGVKPEAIRVGRTDAR